MTKGDNDNNGSSSMPQPNKLLIGPSSQLRAPSSLLSGSLPPSLLEDEDSIDFLSATNNPVAMRPRRLWTIQDTALKRVPPGYPPLNPNCTTYVGDASPSVVAVRISECFRKRSIAVDYDDETVTATALTVDRCSFQVQLYKGNSDLFSHGVIVECMRISGSVISFHTACRAILQAALGQSTGDDTNRPLHHCNGREFQRLPDRFMNPESTMEMNDWKPSPEVSAAQSLEEAKELLHKDRLDTQVLGMERLVDLTTPSLCGKHVSLYTSLQLVQKDPLWLMKRVILDGEVGVGRVMRDSNVTRSMIGSETTLDEGHYSSKVRAFGLRVMCNALSNLSEMDILSGIIEQHKERPHPFTEKLLLDSLMEDLKGVNRPPIVVQAGTNTWASVHEAALALRILRILGEHSETVHRFLESDVVLERMEIARTCGRSTHLVLQQEAERTYAQLTEDIRSC